MHKGIYCIVLRNPACSLSIGALGRVTFRAGFHVYVGSALGPGGLSRVTRHIRCALGDIRKPRWHIDYLLMSDKFSLVRVHCFPTEERLECHLASLIPGDMVRGFGCSDCLCTTHLFSFALDPGEIIPDTAAILGLSALSKTIKK